MMLTRYGDDGIVDPAADLQEPIDHVLRGLHAGQVLVQETDPVGKLLVAEDDVRTEFAACHDPVGLVQYTWIGEQVAAVAVQACAQAAGQDGLAARQPGEPGRPDERQDLGRHGSFRGPETARRRAKMPGVRLDGERKLRGDILGRSKCRLGHGQTPGLDVARESVFANRGRIG